jgi:hypothetical protein
LFFGDIVSGGGSTAILRRALLDEVGFFDETLNYPEDWDLWLRLSYQGLLAYIPGPLAYYRVYGWPRLLSFEASERILAQHLRVIEKAAAAWPGDVVEAEWLRAQALATVYIRTALANLQLGNGQEGLAHLEKAIRAAPELASRDRLMHLAVDRAKLIETETGSFQEAKAFVHTFFANLPPGVAQFNDTDREAVGWLYIGGAFEKFQHNDKAATRRLLAQGVVHAPRCLMNRGVVSLGIQAWLGDSLANRLRKVGNKIIGFAGGPVNAKS